MTMGIMAQGQCGLVNGFFILYIKEASDFIKNNQFRLAEQPPCNSWYLQLSTLHTHSEFFAFFNIIVQLIDKIKGRYQASFHSML